MLLPLQNYGFLKKAFILTVSLALNALNLSSIRAETVANYFDTRERIEINSINSINRIRFLTTVDNPPFNFIDQNGKLSGFHIDLARALCDQLDIARRCQIQAVPWVELKKRMEKGENDVLIAGLAKTSKNREKYLFTRSYLQFSAKFITLNKDGKNAPTNPISLEGKPVGVLADSNFEKMLRSYFPKIKTVTYSRLEWAYDDLQKKKLLAVFGNSIHLSFWLASEGANSCCRFLGGPYFSTDYLGTGLSLAIRSDKENLANFLEYSLQKISTNGKLAEIYLRYFPVSIY